LPTVKVNKVKESLIPKETPIKTKME